MSYHIYIIPEQPDGFEVFSDAPIIDIFPLVVAMDMEDGDTMRRVNHGCEISQVERVGET